MEVRVPSSSRAENWDGPGDSWQLQVDVTETRSLGFLPADPDASKVEDLKEKAENWETTCQHLSTLSKQA